MINIDKYNKIQKNGAEIVTNEYKKTLCDIDLIINELNESERNKIPKKFRKLIHEYKLENYQSDIDINIPLEKQNLDENTKSFLAMLYINYWCKDEAEKQELIDKFSENEKKYQKELSEKYSTEKLFKNKQSNNNANINPEGSEELVTYKQSTIKKILNKIFSLFRKK